MEDLPLIRQLGMRDWNGREFDEEGLVRSCIWVVSQDRGVVLMPLGGGAFEIPEMHDLIFKGKKVRLECGGAGFPATTYTREAGEVSEVCVHVTRIRIPPELAHEKDAILEMAVEALALLSFGSGTSARLTVDIDESPFVRRSNASTSVVGVDAPLKSTRYMKELKLLGWLLLFAVLVLWLESSKH